MATIKRDPTEPTLPKSFDLPMPGIDFNGGAGNDVCYGTFGNDTLRGNSGNDLLVGRGGNDTILGDEGDDTLDGGDGQDYLLGGAGKDTITGGNGNDLISGGTGHDWIDGGANDDNVYGGGGADLIYGGGGDDRIVGGRDADKMYGGMGSDTFVFQAGDLNIGGPAPIDVIADFDPTADVIDLRQLAGLSASGTLFLDDNDGIAEAGEVMLSHTHWHGMTELSIDFEGDGQVDFVLMLSDVSPQSLDAGNILLS
jgi:Ca2+-binding RTX toxin-like protein